MAISQYKNQKNHLNIVKMKLTVRLEISGMAWMIRGVLKL